MQLRPARRRCLMKSTPTLLAAIVAVSFASGCATTEVAAVPPQGDWVLYGQVESVNQTFEHVRGDPGGGAVAGAIIGGVLGTALGGRGLGTFVGATEGAIIGAHTSQGGYVGPIFHVNVRFDDGSLRTFAYRNQLPFRGGEYVVWTPQGLFRR
jgi:outer membrane lipoprotein SlyB